MNEFYRMIRIGVASHVKTRSHDLFLRILFLVPKTGSRRSHGPISRFRFCGENVGISSFKESAG